MGLMRSYCYVVLLVLCPGVIDFLSGSWNHVLLRVTFFTGEVYIG